MSRFVPSFKGSNAFFVLQAELDVVPTVHQAFLAERVYPPEGIHAANLRPDLLGSKVHRKRRTFVPFDVGKKPVDFLLPHPLVRRILVRLPRRLQPGPRRYSFVLGLDRSGRVIHNLQDPSGGFAQISSVERHGGDLYFGSLAEDAIGRLPAP